MLDLGLLDAVSVDAERRVAVAGPGVWGSTLNRRLLGDGLFFPGGHCETVALGGFLTGGGIGWGCRTYGPGCASIVGAEVVLADGSLVHATETEHPDVLWAVRGAGTGLFGVVTAFHLRVVPQPVVHNNVSIYPVALAEEILGWLAEIHEELPRNVDQVLYSSGHLTGAGTTLLLGGFGFGGTPEEAAAAVGLLDAAPFRGAALVSIDEATTPLEMLGFPAATYVEGRRYANDGVWAKASPDAFVSALAPAMASVPAGPSHVNVMNMNGLGAELPDMAFSRIQEHIVEVYGVWEDPADDEAMTRWTYGTAAGLQEAIGSGNQLSNDNMLCRTAPEDHFSRAAFEKLERLRREYDPDGVFAGFNIDGNRSL
jgi:FAD/FMN-containing dehydrogenase